VKIKNLTILLVLTLAIFSTACTKIAPGHVGIVVNNYGEDKGVSSYPAVTGMQWYNPITTDILEFPYFNRNAVWTKSPTEGSTTNEEICFTTKDQVSLCGDVGLSYTLNPKLVSNFYVEYRTNDMDKFTHGFLYIAARSAMSDIGPTYSVEDVMSLRRSQFLKEAKDGLEAKVGKFGVILGNFDFVGSVRPPEGIQGAIDLKIKATQDAIRVENELRSIKAEAAKIVAQAEGTAAANQKVTQSLTPQLIEWRKLDLQSQAVSKWNGALPGYVGGNGPIPFINAH
jgi:regulator of protease activity HflC (stomatin/prohibitin superfamily)